MCKDKPCPKALRALKMLQSSEQSVEQLKGLLSKYKKRQSDLTECIEQLEEDIKENEDTIRVLEREKQSQQEEIGQLQDQLERFKRLLQNDDVQREHAKDVSILKKQLSDRIQENGQLKIDLHHAEEELTALKPKTGNTVRFAVENYQNSCTLGEQGGEGGTTEGVNKAISGLNNDKRSFLRPNRDALSACSVDHMHSVLQELQENLDEQVALVAKRTHELNKLRTTYSEEKKKWKSGNHQSNNTAQQDKCLQEIKDREQQLAKGASMLADASVRNNKLEEAVKLYTTALQFNPRLKACIGNRAYSYLQLKQYHLCIEDCQTYLAAAGPRDSDIYYYRAKSFASLKRYQEALNDIQKCMENKTSQTSAMAAEIRAFRAELEEQMEPFEV